MCRQGYALAGYQCHAAALIATHQQSCERTYQPLLCGCQVSGLTRLMMEGQKDGGAGGSRRENRRETWAPGELP